MTKPSSTPIDYIITEDYETRIVADTILTSDQLPTFTALGSQMLHPKTKKKHFFHKQKRQVI